MKVILDLKGPSIVCQSATYDSLYHIGSHMASNYFKETRIPMIQTQSVDKIEKGRSKYLLKLLEIFES